MKKIQVINKIKKINMKTYEKLRAEELERERQAYLKPIFAGMFRNPDLT